MVMQYKDDIKCPPSQTTRSQGRTGGKPSLHLLLRANKAQLEAHRAFMACPAPRTAAEQVLSAQSLLAGARPLQMSTIKEEPLVSVLWLNNNSLSFLLLF